MQSAVGFLITTLLQMYQSIFRLKKLEIRLRFNRIMAMSLWLHFFGPPCTPIDDLQGANARISSVAEYTEVKI